MVLKYNVYKSIDSVTDVDEAVCYPVKFLNQQNPSLIPLHILKLKIVTVQDCK